MRMCFLVVVLWAFVCERSLAALVFEGQSGPGRGRHLVFIAGDHAYRSEESLPALARLLAKHHGFKCTVLFNIDPDTGHIVAGSSSNIPGLEALAGADLAVFFLRFQDLPDEQMEHIDRYLKRGGSVVGLRTATHAFRIPAGKQFAKYSFKSEVRGYELGFGHQVLGQSWVGHYGRNHRQSTRISIVEAMRGHPILSGVKDVWVPTGAYVGKPIDGEVLTMAQPLDGMEPDSPPSKSQAPMPSEWIRVYRAESGVRARVFTSLCGTSEDLTNVGYRRLLVNGIFWACGLENVIDPELNIAFVGPFRPNTFNNGGDARGIKPQAYAGFTSPIPAHNHVLNPGSKTTRGVSKRNQKESKQ